MTETLPVILYTLFFMGLFYFLAILPENKRKKELESMRNAIKEGDEITTIGGICGKVCAVKESTLVFETGADRVRLEVAKWAVANKGLPSVPETTKKA